MPSDDDEPMFSARPKLPPKRKVLGSDDDESVELVIQVRSKAMPPFGPYFI